MYIVKGSGDRVPYEPRKLRQSLLNAGASPTLADEIVGEMQNILYDGITTRKLYHEAFKKLRQNKRPVAARYQLKRALMELGPSGYAFEEYVGALYRAEGYEVQVGIIKPGNCLTHEIDVFAESEREIVVLECKYGNTSHKKIDSKTALYVHSRMRDIEAKLGRNSAKVIHGGICTNVQFTRDAAQYGKCVGMKMVSWAEGKESLKDYIERLGLYPVTTLTTLTRAQKRQLLADDHVLVRDLYQDPSLLDPFRLSPSRRRQAEEEITEITQFLD